MDPFLGGGDMIALVGEDESTWADVPHKFEAGTPNIADVIAFGAAIEYLEALGMDAVREHEVATDRVCDGSAWKHPRARLFTARAMPEERGGVVSFAMNREFIRTTWRRLLTPTGSRSGRAITALNC